MGEISRTFVMHRHTQPNSVHFDFMLESDDHLLTWRVNTPPDQITDQPAQATKILNHPKKYLTYEGPVQNGTGEVAIVDKGSFALSKECKGKLEFELTGNILTGAFTLTQTSGDNWLIAKSNS
jgi:DNA ligase D-like protein (predicted 3'-phosphoesterase)